MDRRLFLLASLALAGCASAPPRLTPADTALQELEPIYAAVSGGEGLTITVASSGCTAKADFAVYVERKGGVVTLSFGRRRLDTCRTVAMGKAEIAFSWAELGVAPSTPVFLLNPLVAWAGPAG